MLSGAIVGFIPCNSSSRDASLLLSKNDEDVVVVLDDAPVNLSKWSSSDDKSRLFAKGTEFESTGAETLSSSWALMGDVLMGGDRAVGDDDFFELFSNVLTKIFGRK